MSGLEVIGGISAIITMLEASVKIYETARGTLPLSETFEVAGRRLPVLLHILQTCKTSLGPRTVSLSSDVHRALATIINDCEKKARTLSEIFTTALSGPVDRIAWRTRYSEIVRKLGQRKKVNLLMTAITEDVQLLVNHEALGSMTADCNQKLEGILDEVKDIHDLTLREETAAQSFHSSGVQHNNVNSGKGHINTGSGPQINNHGRIGTQNFSFSNITSNDDFDFHGPRGMCLDQAPSMSPELFIAREEELGVIHKGVHPVNEGRHRKQQQQQRIAVGGIGGIGKTQIALTYAQTPDPLYETVIWLNAATEVSLKASFATAAGVIFGAQVSRSLDEAEAVRRTREWLSHPKNSKWLLVFDNFDDPDDFKLDSYYPPAAHGAVIITTRRPDLVTGTTALLHVKSLQNKDDSLMILQTRSKRQNVASDPWAVQLAERLAGLPLALATAGAYLQKSPFSFQRYLQEYEERWNIDPRRPTKLQEYQERTLYTTWDISYNRLVKDDPDAATLLKMMAYLDNQSIRYAFLQAGLKKECPVYELIYDEVNFNGAIAALSEYSFLEFHPDQKEWSMHNCVHDWVTARLNKTIDPQLYWYAFDCVSQSVKTSDLDYLAHRSYSVYVPHAARLSQNRFLKTELMTTITPERLKAAGDVSDLLVSHVQYSYAERLLKELLLRSEAVYSPDDIISLGYMHRLGYLYRAQERSSEAILFLEKALAGKEKILEQDSLSLFVTRLNLGHAYSQQYLYDAALSLYVKALYGMDLELEEVIPRLAEMSEGLCRHMSGMSEPIIGTWMFVTYPLEENGEKAPVCVRLGRHLLDVLDSIGRVLYQTGDKVKGQLIVFNTFLMRQIIQGPSHPSTIQAARNVGHCYAEQGDLKSAEEVLTFAATEREKHFGPNHYSTIAVFQDLGLLQWKQKRLLDAESTYIRALDGIEKTLGTQHQMAIDTILALAALYNEQSQDAKSEVMYRRALSLQERLLGTDHPATIDTAARLGCLYVTMKRFDDAERTFLQIFPCLSNLETIRQQVYDNADAAANFASLYYITNRLHDAERLFLYILEITRQREGPDDSIVMAASINLASIWIETRRLLDAEIILVDLRRRALKAYGPENLYVGEASRLLSQVYSLKEA